MNFQLQRNERVRIYVKDCENSAVKIAADNLVTDLQAVLGISAEISDMPDECKILIGTTGVSEIAGETDVLKKADGTYHKEGFANAVSEGKLFITGTDRRGTVYGIYDFCESMGVSPWYWWADVPVKQKDMVSLPEGLVKADYPTVEYRGIFINDEEELENWVKAHMGEDTIGVKTYERVFELLLRLKANYIWPAMHVNSFNMVRENGALADKMGIVVGTSHCDILMRSNNREWYPWLESKGYKDVEYDYSIEGENRRVLDEYWNDSILQNKDFEVCYTLGMRGIHDWGSSMRAIDENSALTPEEKTKAKVNMLSFIVQTQRKMLADNGVKDCPQIFIPYKEVLDMYDNGLEVPEDVTLVWVDDNFGYVRRYPNETEQQRKGGHGLYYHASYWAFPGMDYLFFSSMPLAHMKNELRKSYENGIRKLWVLNVGAIKPLEQDIEFFLRYAWEIEKERDTGSTVGYLEKWLERNFSRKDNEKLAKTLEEFAQLTNVRKAEHMSYDLFSQNAYGDEGARRINQYAEIYRYVNEVYDSLPLEERDAFYQLVLMKVHAAYYINCDYYFADRSYECYQAGKLSCADYYTELSKKADYYKREVLEYYNKKMAGGKWDKILTPEQYMPPVTAMHPPRTTALKCAEDTLKAVLWNDEKEIVLDIYSTNVKWFELYNPGRGEIAYELEVPVGISVSKSSGVLSREQRIFVTGDDCSARNCEIVVRNKRDGSSLIVPVRVVNEALPKAFSGYVEADGYISMGTAGYGENEGWRQIPHLGRGRGSALESSQGALEYTFMLRTEGIFEAEIFRFPTLNSTGRIRMMLSVDGGEEILVESMANDEWRGQWRENVMSNVDRLSAKLPYLAKGVHTLSVKAIDQYITLSGIVIYTKERRRCFLMPQVSYHTDLSVSAAAENIPALPEDIYKMELAPRSTVYAGSKIWENNGLIDSNISKPLAQYSLRPVQKADEVIREQDGRIKIDAEKVLSQNENAFAVGKDWCHADSETGFSMYIRKKGLRWDNLEQAPSLNYKIDVTHGGTYHIWALLKMDENPSMLAFGIDGCPQPLAEQNNHGNLWTYEAKQIWRWTPICDMNIEKGEHLFSVYDVTSGVRIDRVYLTKGDELPPDGMEW